MKQWILCLMLGSSLSMPTLAQHSHGAHTPYAGLQNRAIKSLSDKDMEELRRGGGWGLALPAELNGMPGPAHLLELKDKIGLSEDQARDIQSLFDQMKQEHIDYMLSRIPMGRFLQVDEAAAMVTWLASNDCAFTTGSVFDISGGRATY